MKHVTLAGLNVIRSFEGRSLRAYKDSVGVWTIGYGITNYDKGIGFRVAAGVAITAEQAESMLVKSLRANYEPACNQVLPAATPNAFDAATSFHFNTGGIHRATWPQRLNAGDMEGARVSLESWNKAGGRPLSGLTRRRAREWAIIAKADYGPEGRTGPSITEPGASGFEIQTGRTGEVLTQYPNVGDGTPPSVPSVPISDPPTGPAAPPPEKQPAPDHGAPVPHPSHVPGVLVTGDTDAEVIVIRSELTALGYPSQEEHRPGVTNPRELYTVALANAVYTFQQHHPNLTADGKFGPATRAQLQRDWSMRQKGKKAAGGGAVVIGGAVGAAQKGVDIGTIALVVTCLAVIALVYFAIKYPDELKRRFNKLVGRVVP